MRTLSAAEARRVYDRIGRAQDTQAFYEDRATSWLVAHLDLGAARSVFEFGCGTGRFAAMLLAQNLPETAVYRAVDVSPVMVDLARQRLAPFAPRAVVRLTDGAPPTNEPAESYDRFISNFVFDLLSVEDIRRAVDQAYRMLRPGGLIGLCSMTAGFTASSRAFVWFWSRVHMLRPSLVGGCRPLELSSFLPEGAWAIRHLTRVAPLGVPLEGVVAQRS